MLSEDEKDIDTENDFSQVHLIQKTKCCQTDPNEWKWFKMNHVRKKRRFYDYHYSNIYFGSIENDLVEAAITSRRMNTFECNWKKDKFNQCAFQTTTCFQHSKCDRVCLLEIRLKIAMSTLKPDKNLKSITFKKLYN